MRLAISNIAWDVSEDASIANLLKQFKIDAIDIAPGKYFPLPQQASDQEIAAVKHAWSERGMQITGMQALLFGATALQLFASDESRAAMRAHLTAICRIGAGLGAQRLVFGAPKNRDRGHLSDQQTLDIAIPFFRQLGNIAAEHQVLICVEPNPACYGCNFMTHSMETAALLSEIAHPAIKMQLDTGTITINGEDIETVLSQYAGLIGHIHASEAHLRPLGDTHHPTMPATALEGTLNGSCPLRRPVFASQKSGSPPTGSPVAELADPSARIAVDHHQMAQAIKKYLPQHVVCIEMLATPDEPHASSIERALGTALRYYGS